MRLAAIALLLGLSSCFEVTNLDRFTQPAALVQGNYNDLSVAWRGMNAHVNQYVEFRVIDNSNVIQSRGIFDPLGAVDVSFLVPSAVPKLNGPFRFDFWADNDENGVYDLDPAGADKDHSWRLPLDSSLLNDNAQYVISFDHNFSFTDVSTPKPVEIGKPATLHITAVGAFANRRFEMRVADASSGHVVALYRVGSLTKATYDLVVPGMIESGSAYTVSLYTDDGNLGAVRAFTLPATATDTGLELSFDGNNPTATPGLTEVTDKNAITAP